MAQTWIELPFADGKYLFKLGVGQIAEIERVGDAGIGRIYARTRAGRYGFKPGEALPEEGEYRWTELVEIIRQGLIGGGSGMVDDNEVTVHTPRANDLVDRYLIQATDQRMAMTHVWALAYAILHALIEGYVPPKKAAPAEKPAASTKGSTSRKRSRTAP